MLAISPVGKIPTVAQKGITFPDMGAKVVAKSPLHSLTKF